jgi:ferredoxin
MVRLLDQVMVPRVPTRKERTEIERMDHRTAQPNQARVCAESTVYTVCVEPQGIELVARHGETVIAAAERLGWRWPTICHGDGECSVCWVKVIGGSAHISPMSEDERATLELLPSSIIDKNDSSPVRLRLPSPDSWRRHRGQEGGHAAGRRQIDTPWKTFSTPAGSGMSCWMSSATTRAPSRHHESRG